MKLVSDISTKSWQKINEESDNQIFLQLLFCFRDNGELPVNFNNLSFGASIKQEEEILYSFIEPEPNFVYDSTDQDFIFVFVANNLEANTEYVLNVWSINNQEKWEDSFILTFPELLTEPPA